MSDIVNEAANRLNEKLAGRGFDAGTAKFVFAGLGSMVLDAAGARVADDEADVTFTAAPEVFQALFEGELNPTMAFMSGKLAVEGNMGLAMKLASVLA